jgi:hypothetical protein
MSRRCRLIYAVVLSVLGATVLLDAQAPASANCTLFSDLSVGQFILFLTTIAGFGISWLKERRQRNWDLEDRKMAREESDRKATALSEKVLEAKHAAVAVHRDLSEKIDHNTQISHGAFQQADSAYKEANQVNSKIAALQQKFLDVKTDANAPHNRRRSDQ